MPVGGGAAGRHYARPYVSKRRYQFPVPLLTSVTVEDYKCYLGQATSFQSLPLPQQKTATNNNKQTINKRKDFEKGVCTILA